MKFIKEIEETDAIFDSIVDTYYMLTYFNDSSRYIAFFKGTGEPMKKFKEFIICYIRWENGKPRIYDINNSNNDLTDTLRMLETQLFSADDRVYELTDKEVEDHILLASI